MMKLISKLMSRFKGNDTNALPLRRPEYDERLRMNLRDWLRFHQEEIVLDKVTWMGKRIWKNVLDAWIYQEIIWEVHPDVILEIGSKYGGSTLFLANMLDMIDQGIVLSIETDRSQYDVNHSRIISLTGSSADPVIIAEADRRCRGKKVLVIQDGDHRKFQALKDLENYSGFVSVGSYFIMEDGIVDLFHAGDGLGFENDGPLAAVETFLEGNKNFAIDQSRERYLLTYNPKGYLKRIA